MSWKLKERERRKKEAQPQSTLAVHKEENIMCEGKVGNISDPSLETPTTPLMMDNNNIKPDVYKIDMTPIFEPDTNADLSTNKYDGPNSVPPPSGPPPTFPKMQNDNSIPPPAGPPPSLNLVNNCENHNIEMQPNFSSLAAPNTKSIRGTVKRINPFGKHDKQDSIVWMDSPRETVRTATSINRHIDASKGLCWLFTIVVLIIISCLAMTSCIQHYIFDIRIKIGVEGTYVWSFGWLEDEFTFMNDAQCDSCLLTDYAINDIKSMKFPIPNTLIYAQNAGYFFIATVGIILFWVACILFVLCERRNARKILYLKCCGFQVPQRAFVFFAFDVINVFAWICLIYYTMLIMYGYIESNFYLQNMCTATTDLDCTVYVIPHYGFCALLTITLPIVFCAFSKTKGLDTKLTAKTYPIYFSKNAKKALPRFILGYLFSSLSAVKMICILSFVMWVSFKDVGMISVSFVRKGVLDNALGRYFQGIGLRNADDFMKLDSMPESNSDRFGTAINIITTWEPNDFSDEMSTFNSIATYWNWWICGIMIVNMLFVAPYKIFVVDKYKSYKCIKFLIIWVTLFELLGHIGFMVTYYYEFSTMFIGHVQSDWKTDLSDMTGSAFDVAWFPDWGLLVSIMLCFYLLKSIYATSKAT